MKIGIIGAGYVGLSAGYKLAKEGHNVTIFERTSKPGGLAGGFRAKNWQWALEEHYHHWFTSDMFVRNLAQELSHEIIFTRPKTSVIIGEEIFQLDSPISLMKFPHLPVVDRIRTGSTLLLLKSNPYWKNLEKVTAEKYLQKYMGKTSWDVLWKSLFEGKFGKYASEIPASWFWSRIKKRSASLGYPVGGFESFATSLAERFANLGGKIIYNSEIQKISKDRNKIRVIRSDNSFLQFDKVICTLPTNLFTKITDGLPKEYLEALHPLKGIGAVTLVLTLKDKFFSDGTYWLNINDSGYPFLALVEHTNLIDKKHYDNENILYIGNYLEPTHKYFGYDTDRLINEFTPHLTRINNKFNKANIIASYVFKTPFAQPIVPLNYSKQIPALKTPIDGLYLANIQQVYPWDRGTNYAVELGYKVADLILKENEKE